MSVNIFYPTKENPYCLPSEPVILRTACAAGINRSAVVRQLLKEKLHPASRVYSQFGAYRGDYNDDNKYIYAYHIDIRDGFYECFGVDKAPNLQSIIFKNMGYEKPTSNYKLEANAIVHLLDSEHVNEYQANLEKYYWRTTNIPDELKIVFSKNIFVLINEWDTTQNLVIKRLTEAGEDVDLVILAKSDTIESPIDTKIEPQSKLAYQLFIDDIKQYFA